MPGPIRALGHRNFRFDITARVLSILMQALAPAGLTHLDAIGPAVIVARSALLGVPNAFDTPLRGSRSGGFVGRREDLPSALALNAMAFDSGRLVGVAVHS